MSEKTYTSNIPAVTPVETLPKQFVLDRTDMSTSFSDSEYQACLDAIIAGQVVAVNWIQGGTARQLQLVSVSVTGILKFSYARGYDLETWTVAAFSPHSITHESYDVNPTGFAPTEYGTNKVHNLPTTITAFSTGDVIPVDGPSGTAKMSKDSLLELTAQNALAGNVAPAFDPTRTSENPYKAGEAVMYGGKLYVFHASHYGAWSNAHAINVPMSGLFATGEVLQRLAGNRLDDSQFTKPGATYGDNGAIITRSNYGASGLCPCIPGEKLFFWRAVATDANRFYNNVVYYDKDGNYLTTIISSSAVRKDVVPDNAYFFSVPILYEDGKPVDIVVAGFLPNKFIPYSPAHEKTKSVVDSCFIAKNLFDPSAATEGSYISAITNGAEVWSTDSSVGMSDYIPVRNGLLFCWYDYIEPHNLWPWVYCVIYNSNKEPLRRRTVSIDQPEIFYLDAGAAYVRLQYALSHKNEIAVGHHKFSRYVPFSGMSLVYTSDVVQNLGNDDKKVMSQAAVTEAIENAGIEPDEFDIDVTDCKTDVIAIARNYVLKEYEESGTRYFEFSNDNGKNFVKVENTIGQINFIHFFSTGRVLICGAKKVYYTDDFSSFTETSVYDYDGTAFVADVNHFYRLGNYNSEYNEIEGREVLIWNDYNVESGYKSRVWFTDDFGATLKCILKSGEATDRDGNVISVKHFHRTFLDNKTGNLWVTSGDSGDLCKLLLGKIENGDWVFDVVNKGNLYKLSQFIVKHPYAFFITDYTNGVDPTGIAACPLDGLNDPDNFRYLYKTDNNEALSKYFEDDNGYRLIFPDGEGTRKFWFANGDFDFKKLSVVGGSGNIVLDNVYGPSYSGDVVCLSHTNGYGVAINPSMSGYQRYNLSKMMKNAGFKNFGKIRKFFDRLQ